MSTSQNHNNNNNQQDENEAPAGPHQPIAPTQPIGLNRTVKEIARLRQVLESAEAENATMKEELATMDSENQKLREKVVKAEGRIKELEKEKAKLLDKLLADLPSKENLAIDVSEIRVLVEKISLKLELKKTAKNEYELEEEIEPKRSVEDGMETVNDLAEGVQELALSDENCAQAQDTKYNIKIEPTLSEQNGMEFEVQSILKNIVNTIPEAEAPKIRAAFDYEHFLSLLPAQNDEYKLNLFIESEQLKPASEPSHRQFWDCATPGITCCSRETFFANLDNFHKLLCGGEGRAFYKEGVEVFKGFFEKDFCIPVKFFDNFINNALTTKAPEKIVKGFQATFFHDYKLAQDLFQDLPDFWRKNESKVQKYGQFHCLEMVLHNMYKPAHRFKVKINAMENKMAVFAFEMIDEDEASWL